MELETRLARFKLVDAMHRSFARAWWQLRTALALGMALALALAGCGGGGGADTGGVPGTLTAPTITSQPASVSVAAGTIANFTVVATGNGLAYQWFRSTTGGVSWAEIAGATSATYSIAAVDASMNGHQFRVAAQNGAGIVTSAAATLTVSGGMAAPLITQQPADVDVESSILVSFAVAVTGAPTPTIGWEMSSDGGATYSAVTGATGATLQLAPTSLADSGKRFRAVATNSGGTARSNAATLTVRRGAVGGYPHSIAVATNGLIAFTTRIDAGNFASSTTGVLQTANAQAEVGTLALALGTMVGPAGVAFDASGNLLVAESGRHRILKVTPQGQVSTFAGSGALGCADGPAATACFFAPWGLTVDGAGNVVVAEFGGARIRKISTTGQVSTIAGAAGSGYLDGSAAVARFANPQGAAVDASGNLFIADTGNHAIRKIAPDGTVITFAGLGGQSGLVDGAGTAARFSSPYAVALDSSGNVFVADAGNGAIRKISSQGVVTTVAGGPTVGYVDATGTAARFGFVTGISVDGAGNLLVADATNSAIRHVTPAGAVTTFVKR